METYLIFFLKTGIATILFYAFYRLIIFQNTYYKVRRFTLLAILFFSVGFPFITYSSLFPGPLAIETVRLNDLFGGELPEVIVKSGGSKPVFSFAHAALAVYLSVSLLLLLRMMVALLSIYRMYRRSEPVTYRGERIRLLTGSETPFSFFRLIFFNPRTKTDDEASQILMHELTHARQCHSADILLSELFVIVFWFNPFSWLFRQEVRVNLEMLADEHVIRSGVEPKSYQYALLKLCHPLSTNKLVNNFNVSQFKRRIIMMNKNKSSRFSLVRYLLLLPVGMLLIIACNAEDAPKATAESGDVVEAVILPTDEETPKLSGTVFTVVDEMPEYPGGPKEMLQFIGKNIAYPQVAIDQQVEGRVIVSFVVSKEGKVTDPVIVRGISPELDAEALRVVSTLPDWTPGRQQGEAVNVKYTLPVRFRLTDDKSTPVKSQERPKYRTVVDGKLMPADFTPDQLSPDQIARISIIKEGAAKQYGEEAKDGVMLIELKK